MSTDPRKGCLIMKRPRKWQDHQRAKEPEPPAPAPAKTYHFSPRGDSDSFVKFFSGDTRVKRNDPEPD